MIVANIITSISIMSLGLVQLEPTPITTNRRYRVQLKRQISEHGLNMIKNFETINGKPELEAYVCPAGVLTIGYGHTGADVKKGMKITPEEAERLLIKDTQRFVDNVNKVVRPDITQNKFDSLVSLAFNIGNGNFNKSTLLKKINSGAPEDEILHEFSRWNKGDGKVLKGLVERRRMEAENYARK